MTEKRVTIYDIAKELGIAASAVSKALNNQKGVSPKVKDRVLKKARELNYKHNLHAANLRHGKSKTLGVVVPHLNQTFFSGVIAGIEDACFENNHRLIICQSHDLFNKEQLAIQTLIHQDVDCILISISTQTTSSLHLQEVINNKIHLVQFDRCITGIESDLVLNDNREAAYQAVISLIQNGYKRIAFLGGPQNLANYYERKTGYFEALRDCGLEISNDLIADNLLSREKAQAATLRFLKSDASPDAVFAVSDLQALAASKAAEVLGIQVPEELGLFGFANESFAELVKPSLSSVDQKSWHIGYEAANLYFSSTERTSRLPMQKVVKCELQIRDSSNRQTL